MKTTKIETKVKVLKLATGVAFLLALTSCAEKKDSSITLENNSDLLAGNIVNGTNATTSFQKQAGVVGLVITSDDGQGICTGTLIAKRLVLTAAHCILETSSRIQRIYVLFSTDVTKAKRDNIRLATTGVPHEDFLASAMGRAPTWNDIALLKLNEDAPADFQLAQLPTEASNSLLLEHGKVIQAGFGKAEASRTAPRDSSGVLRKVENIELIKLTDDKKEMHLKENGKGSCNGDSGGPAYVRQSDGRLVQVGLNSRGTSPTTCLEVGVFTNVSAHLDWIKEKSAELMTEPPTAPKSTEPSAPVAPADPVAPAAN